MKEEDGGRRMKGKKGEEEKGEEEEKEKEQKEGEEGKGRRGREGSHNNLLKCVYIITNREVSSNFTQESRGQGKWPVTLCMTQKSQRKGSERVKEMSVFPCSWAFQ
jgi:ssDNA-binding Zn-finger/Zn-ribbon topoisomerase 1